MKAVQKVSTAICEYLGYSASATRATSKELAPRLSKALAGKSKGEKKEFLTALENLTKENCQPEKEYKTLLKTLGYSSSKNSEQIARDSALYNGLTLPLATRRGILSLEKEFPKIFDETVSKSLTDSISKIDTSRIVKEVMEQHAKDAKKLLGRTVIYPFTKTVSYFVPSATRKQLSQLTKLPKSEFGKSYYNELISSNGLTGRAPSNFSISNKSAGLNISNIMANSTSCEGGFNMITNKIEFTKEFATLSRARQASYLRHELKHFEQVDTVIRTYGIDRYIQAQKNGMLNRARQEYSATKSESEIRKLVDEYFKENHVEEQIRTSFAESIKAARINPTSEAGKMAEKYISGIENYTGLTKKGLLTESTKDYLKNPLEVEAYSIGNKARRQVALIESLNLNAV